MSTPKKSNLKIVGNGAANQAASKIKKDRDRKQRLIDEMMKSSGLPISRGK
jgi:hypothetical protein